MNYYDLLGMPSSATPAEIEQKIKEEYRKNQRRMNHADQAKRQAAERRAEQLMEAKRVLLDPAQRQAHDLRLSAAPTVGPAMVSTNDWLAEAAQRMEAGDYHGALYCANEARRVLGDGVAAAWRLMAQANGSLGNARQALFEARRAVSLDPAEPEHHYLVGLAHTELEQWDAALQAFETVRRLDPTAEYATVESAEVLMRSGRGAAGLQLLETLYATATDPEFVGDALGFALTNAAEMVPAYREHDGYTVTAPAEIHQMRAYLSRARHVSTDPELHGQIDQMEQYLRDCEVRRLPPDAWIRSFGVVKVSGVIAVALALLCVCGNTTDEVGPAVIAGLLLVGYLAVLGLVYAVSLEPQWKTNLKAWQFEQGQFGPWR
ncbi:tetratricopeptide (TPR) repeat protein [Hamadaea flava]|uniref:DnaJ domain-containing protein n=1 Tax=Hamadaea flava TaxID=1742688 RepID=A0ABV8LZ83_9ACTN|nr:DnaJ domain-containing protein [Hamadaea flava]MCP2329176.1 tetratricopeptide (TPR) repeat protein [Hamadaea flava]